MANHQPSPVAEAVAAALPEPDHPGDYPAPHRGAIMVRGYLGPLVDGEPRRLFLEDSFRVWLEFETSDILHSIPGGTDPCCAMGTVWLKRESPIRKVTTGYAHVLLADTEEGGYHHKPWGMTDDPGGYHRKPYP